MSTSDICDALKTAMTEIQIDGLTGTEMHWTAEGEPQKAPKAVEIKDGKYEMMQNRCGYMYVALMGLLLDVRRHRGLPGI